jgi:hypothetical protein
MSWRIYSRNLARDDAGFCRMARSGDRLAAISESATKSDAIIFLWRREITGDVFSIDARSAGVIFLAFAGYGALAHA